MSGANKDTANISEFTDHLWDFNKYGITLVELILGNDLGLFEVLKDANRPLTSMEIAKEAGFKERYVREWLSAISAANVIKAHVEDDTCTYSLTDERYNIVKTAVTFGKGISSALGRFDLIKACFQIDGPMGDPAAFGKCFEYFHEYRTHEVKTDVCQKMFRDIESVKSLHEKLEGGCNVLDIGCGPGDVTIEFAKRYPKSFFTGIETSTYALDKAMTRAKEADVVLNISFKRALTDELGPGRRGLFDVVMLMETLHNLPDPIQMIEDVERLLKPGGKLILQELNLKNANNEIDMEKASMFSMSQFHCLPFSMSGEPHVGYAVGWGREAMLKALGKYFTLNAHFPMNYDCIFCLTKNGK